MRYFSPRLLSSFSAHLLVILVCFFVFYVNKLPEGYIVSGTDHKLFLDLNSSFWNFFYTWTNDGAGSPNFLQASLLFYAIQYIFSHLNVPFEKIQSYTLFFFIYFSFWSFYISLFILNLSNEIKKLQIFYSLVYGINGYTLYLFMHVFGYFYQAVLYLFIPVIVALFYSALRDGWNIKKSVLFIIVLFLSSMGFNNPGFFVATCAVLAIIFAASSLMHIKYLDSKRVVSFFWGFIIILGTNSFWLLPYLGEAFSVGAGLENDIWNLENWIRWQSTHIVDLFRLLAITQIDKFPYNSFFDDSVIAILVFLSFLPLFLLLLGLVSSKRKSLSIILLFTYSLLILLTAKAKGPFGDLAVFLFAMPIINSLRSYDKFFIFIPYFLLTVIYLVIMIPKKIGNWVKYVFVVLLLIYPIPFYTGKLQQNISTAFKPGETFQTAEYSNLVRIPNEYNEVSNIVNNSTRHLSKIMYLPFDAFISPGWSQYPKWRFRGNDVTATLFEKPVLRPSVYLSNLKFNYGKLFDNHEKTAWIKKFMGFANIEFIVFHKDVPLDSWRSNHSKINELEKSFDLTKIYSGEYIDLYRLDNKYFLPLIYIPNNIHFYQDFNYHYFPDFLDNSKIEIGSAVIEVTSRDFSKLITQSVPGQWSNLLSQLHQGFAYQMPVITDIQKINPTKYVIKVTGANGVFPLVFSESFHGKWRLRPLSIPISNNVENNKIYNACSESIFFHDSSGSACKNNLDMNFIDSSSELSYLWSEMKINLHNLLNKIFFNEPPADNSYLHLQANGFANIWFIDSDSLCKDDTCIIDDVGSRSFNLIIEFAPQKYFYLGLFFTFVTLLSALFLILYKLFVSSQGKFKEFDL